MNPDTSNNKTNIEELLNGIDRQLLSKLLDSLVKEQIPDVEILPKEKNP